MELHLQSRVGTRRNVLHRAFPDETDRAFLPNPSAIKLPAPAIQRSRGGLAIRQPGHCRLRLRPRTKGRLRECSRHLLDAKSIRYLGNPRILSIPVRHSLQSQPRFPVSPVNDCVCQWRYQTKGRHKPKGFVSSGHAAAPQTRRSDWPQVKPNRLNRLSSRLPADNAMPFPDHSQFPTK